MIRPILVFVSTGSHPPLPTYLKEASNTSQDSRYSRQQTINEKHENDSDR
jgi:hypothetical protein